MQNEHTEEWRALSSLKSLYSVSNLARVRREKPRKNGELIILAETKSLHGYLMVQISIDGKRVWKKVHRLVAEAFMGACPVGKEVNHKDGDKTNNLPDNLEYVTRQENMAHAWRTGLCKSQEYVSSRLPHPTKLTESTMLYIMTNLGKLRQIDIAKNTGVSQAMISKIANGFKHKNPLPSCLTECKS